MTTTPEPDPEPCLRFHALFLDTQLDIFCPPGLARLVAGRGRGRPPAGDPPPLPDKEPEDIPAEKGAVR
ncbi:hypothetical protein ACFV7R_37395 [Streptomyces sp. NPDC059866]|uniref:hypothetical protein n=1 Tax=Streptomyces sp. NPDC059866 TaxID=3346978 RepID=UPI003669985C